MTLHQQAETLTLKRKPRRQHYHYDDPEPLANLTLEDSKALHCSHESKTLVTRQQPLKARALMISGHTIPELYYQYQATVGITNSQT